jgi:hypothetical protein
LGRSLQLVTENFGRYSSAADRRKKSVRFNSEEWIRNAAALSAAGYNPPAAYPTSLLSSFTPGGRYLDGSCLFGADDEDSWMSIEDVLSGRWARWDALRQESQDSQTRDSGIETGSCFTSSEDSNRGGDIYLSKKVRRVLNRPAALQMNCGLTENDSNFCIFYSSLRSLQLLTWHFLKRGVGESDTLSFGGSTPLLVKREYFLLYLVANG